MRNKNLFTFFLIFLCFCFTNCSDDEKTEDIHHLSFEKDYYGNHSIFRLDTHRNPAYLCAITNY